MRNRLGKSSPEDVSKLDSSSRLSSSKRYRDRIREGLEGHDIRSTLFLYLVNLLPLSALGYLTLSLFGPRIFTIMLPILAMVSTLVQYRWVYTHDVRARDTISERAGRTVSKPLHKRDVPRSSPSEETPEDSLLPSQPIERIFEEGKKSTELESGTSWALQAHALKRFYSLFHSPPPRLLADAWQIADTEIRVSSKAILTAGLAFGFLFVLHLAWPVSFTYRALQGAVSLSWILCGFLISLQLFSLWNHLPVSISRSTIIASVFINFISGFTVILLMTCTTRLVLSDVLWHRHAPVMWIGLLVWVSLSLASLIHSIVSQRQQVDTPFDNGATLIQYSSVASWRKGLKRVLLLVLLSFAYAIIPSLADQPTGGKRILIGMIFSLIVGLVLTPYFTASVRYSISPKIDGRRVLGLARAWPKWVVIYLLLSIPLLLLSYRWQITQQHPGLWYIRTVNFFVWMLLIPMMIIFAEGILLKNKLSTRLKRWAKATSFIAGVSAYIVTVGFLFNFPNWLSAGVLVAGGSGWSVIAIVRSSGHKGVLALSTHPARSFYRLVLLRFPRYIEYEKMAFCLRWMIDTGHDPQQIVREMISVNLLAESIVEGKKVIQVTEQGMNLVLSDRD